MNKFYIFILIVFISFLFVGCNKGNDNGEISTKNTEETLWKNNPKDFTDGWVLSTDIQDNKYGTYLGNGYLGIRLFASGLAYSENSPTSSYMAGIYSGETLVSVPNIADLHFYDIKNSQVTEFKQENKNYKQFLNLKDASLHTQAIYSVGKKKVKADITTKVLRLKDKSSRVLININLKPEYKGQFFVFAPVDYNKATFDYNKDSYALKGSKKTLYAKQNIFISNANKSDQYLSLKTICMGSFEQGTQCLFDVEKNKEVNITYFAELSDEPIEKSVSIEDIKIFEKEHNSNWADLWKSDIEIEGDPVAQQVSRSNIFYLLCSASEDYSIAPMGLSMNAFSGHTFWDAEMWMFPALIWMHPEFAKGMINYRINTLKGAILNAEIHGNKGAEYAWESGETGIETSPDSSTIKERHINGDIAFSIWQYYVITGDKNTLKKAYPVLKSTADYWLSKVTKNENGKYEIKQVCAPDEDADIVDNSVYTNAIAQINLWITTEAAKILGENSNPEYMAVANNIFIGIDKDNNRFNIYDNYTGKKIKQADPELLLYPLKYNEFTNNLNNEYKFSDDLYKNTFNYYKNNITSNGPAMTSSAHAVYSARSGNRESYNDFEKSFKPFMRGYYNYFNEKKSATYINWCFLTGAASSYASILWGFCGLDADYYNNYNNSNFMYKNNLPSQWKSVTIRGIKYKGKIYNLKYKDGNVVLESL